MIGNYVIEFFYVWDEIQWEEKIYVEKILGGQIDYGCIGFVSGIILFGYFYYSILGGFIFYVEKRLFFIGQIEFCVVC